jgi:hypothetical protein
MGADRQRGFFFFSFFLSFFSLVCDQGEIRDQARITGTLNFVPDPERLHAALRSSRERGGREKILDTFWAPDLTLLHSCLGLNSIPGTGNLLCHRDIEDQRTGTD